jgi:CHAT domain-containing protein/tetratricopeptide (TPR) repeat protein
LYWRTGAYVRARPLIEKALQTVRQTLGEEHSVYGTSLNNLALLDQTLGDYARAERLFRQALRIKKQTVGENDPGYVNALGNLAELYRVTGAYARALPLQEKALQILKRAGGEDSPSYALTLNNLALLYRAMGDHARAEKFLAQALQIQKRIVGEGHSLYATTLNNLASLYKAMGAYARALPLYEQALRIRKKALGERHAHYAASLHHLATLYEATGASARALPLYEQALAIKKQALGENHPDYAGVLVNLGGLYRTMGDYARAEPLLEQALRISKQTLGEDHPDHAINLNNLALLYQDRGDSARALRLYDQALQTWKRTLGEQHPTYAAGLTNLAVIYWDRGEYAKALPLCEQALRIKQRTLGEDHPDYAVSLNNLAQLYRAQGDRAKAQAAFVRALRIKQRVLGEDHPSCAVGLDNLALLYASGQRWPEAWKATLQAERIFRRHVSRVLPALAEPDQLTFLRYWHRGSLYSALSLGLLRPSDETAVTLSAGSLINGKAVAQQALASRVLLARDHPDPASARLIEELLAVRKHLANLTFQGPPAGQVVAYRQDLARLGGREQDLATQLGRVQSSALLADPWVELDQLRRALPDRGVLIDLARFPVLDFRANKGKGQWQPARYGAWVVPPRGRGSVRLIDLGPAAPIDRAVQAVRRDLAAAPARMRQAGEPDAERALGRPLHTLAGLILRPLWPHIAGSERWLLSPDGALWLVPWAALPLPDGSYAVEKHTVSYLVSGRDLAQKPARAQRGSAAVVLADPDYDLGPTQAQRLRTTPGPALLLRGRTAAGPLPRFRRLPGTAVEARAITPALQRYAGESPRLYTGKEALEGVVKALRRPRVLVLSTHGFFLDDQVDAVLPLSAEASRGLKLMHSWRPRPRGEKVQVLENALLRCGLALAGANQRNQATADSEDGILTGLEIAGCDLRGTELVVLSACETGLGKVNVGEGVAGLRQAFQLAGAEAVLATLWQIPDRETARLMSRFFRELAGGRGKAEALRRAQLEVIRQRRARGKAAHPFYWAAFALTGQWQ